MIKAKEARIAIYGAGAMGTVLGAWLTEDGLQVDLITRNQAHIQALREKGATVEYAVSGQTATTKVNALFPSEMSGQYDVIFLMTKQRQNKEILTQLLPYLKEDGVVCTTQNGLPEPSVAEIVGEERTYGAVTSYGATFIESGKVEMTSDFSAIRMQVGGYKNDGAKLPLLEEILSCVGDDSNEGFVQTTDNLLGARWGKLAINGAFSGLSTMTGLTFGEIAQRSKTRKLTLGILREAIAVAKASGVTLEKMQGHNMEKMLGGSTPLQRFFAYLVLPLAMKKHKKLLSGMLKDIQNGRRCEIDFINGVIVKEGAKAGVETPLCSQLVEIVHGIEDGLYEIDYKNADFFEI